MPSPSEIERTQPPEPMTTDDLATIRTVLAGDPRSLSPVILHLYASDLLAEVQRLRTELARREAIAHYRRFGPRGE